MRNAQRSCRETNTALYLRAFVRLHGAERSVLAIADCSLAVNMEAGTGVAVRPGSIAFTQAAMRACICAPPTCRC